MGALTKPIVKGLTAAITAAIVGLGAAGGSPVDAFTFGFSPTANAATGVGPGIVTGFTYTRSSVGALVPQYTGDLYQPEINEIPLYGGRRVRNLRKNSLSSTIVFTNNASVLGREITLSVDNASYHYLRDEWPSQFPIGTKFFGRITVSCAAGSRTVGVRFAPGGGGAADSVAGTVGPTPTTFTFSFTSTTVGSVDIGLDLRSSIVPGIDTSPGVFTVDEVFVQVARTGQTVIDPEYVSNGVLSAPFHGWGVDGVKHFSTDEYGNDLTVEDALGPELVTNGGFDADSDWVKNTGWTISGGAATYDGTGGTSPITQEDVVVAGKTYTIEFDVVSNEGSGANSVYLGATGLVNNTHLTPGTYSFEGVAAGVGHVYIYGRASEAFEIDNVSIREIYPVRCDGWMRRPQIKNEISYSDWSTGWTIGGGVTTTAKYGDGPRGALTATRIQIATTNHVKYQQLATSPSGSGSKYCFSFMFKSLANTTNLKLTVTGASMTGAVPSMEISPTGVISNATNVLASGSEAVPGMSGWYRVWLTCQTTGGGTLLYYLGQFGTGAIDMLIDCVNVDTRDALSDPVTSGAAPTTATVETAEMTAAGLGFSVGGGTYVLQCTPMYPPTYNSNGQICFQGFTGTADSLQLYNRSGAFLGTLLYISFVDQAGLSSATWTAGSQMIIVVRHELNDVRLTVDSDTPQTDTSAALLTFTKFLLGSGNFHGRMNVLLHYGAGVIDDTNHDLLAAGNLPVL